MVKEEPGERDLVLLRVKGLVLPLLCGDVL